MPSEESTKFIPQLVRESEELEEMLFEYLKRANESQEATPSQYIECTEKRRPPRLRGSRSEASLGLKVSSYEFKVERAQAEALEMRKEMMA